MTQRHAQLSTVVELDEHETRRLANVLSRGFDPPPALLSAWHRFADPSREAPELTWPDPAPPDPVTGDRHTE